MRRCHGRQGAASRKFEYYPGLKILNGKVSVCVVNNSVGIDNITFSIETGPMDRIEKFDHLDSYEWETKQILSYLTGISIK